MPINQNQPSHAMAVGLFCSLSGIFEKLLTSCLATFHCHAWPFITFAVQPRSRASSRKDGWQEHSVAVNTTVSTCRTFTSELRSVPHFVHDPFVECLCVNSFHRLTLKQASKLPFFHWLLCCSQFRANHVWDSRQFDLLSRVLACRKKNGGMLFASVDFVTEVC